MAKNAWRHDIREGRDILAFMRTHAFRTPLLVVMAVGVLLGGGALYFGYGPQPLVEAVQNGFTKEAAACDGVCFDNLVRKTVEEDGVDAAYKLFTDAFARGELPRSCHWTAHQIGEAAYELFRQGKDIPISESMSYCGYGFFHGFLEGLLRENPDPREALKFCDVINERLGSMGLQNCYHGIGHGYTEDPPYPASIGDFQAMIAPGIDMCEYLFGKNFTNLNLCMTGVFTVPAGFAKDEKYGLSFDKKDPFKYCKGQPYRYLKACYGEFAPKLDSVLEWDIRKLPPYVSAIKDEKLKRLVTWVVPSVMMAHDILAADNSSYIIGCRESFTGRLRLICWGGTIQGFMQHGEPEKQHTKVFSFCAASAWDSEEERMFCWGEGLRQLRMVYASDTMHSICTQVPAVYQHLCFDEAHTHASPYDDPSFDDQ